MNNKESSVCITRCINVRVSNISEKRKKKIKTKKNPYPSIKALYMPRLIDLRLLNFKVY